MGGRLIIIALLVCLSGVLSAQGWFREYLAYSKQSAGEVNYYDVQSWARDYFKDVEQEIRELQSQGVLVQEADAKRFEDYIKYKRWEWQWSSRINDNGTLGGPSQHAVKVHKAKQVGRKSSAWGNIGFATNSGGYWGMGRAECLGLHPTDAHIFYVGTTGGGIWKTTDGGNTYLPIGDDLPIAQIAEIIVDFENPNIVYAAVGPRGGWWNKSVGVYKSTDAGGSWQPTGFAYDYADGSVIEDMVMCPANSSLLLVARGDGIYRSSDAGITWNRVYTSYTNDLAWKYGDANTVYATKNDYWGSCEVLKSTDAGQSWTTITGMSIQKNVLKIATTPANPELIAYFSASENKALYVSLNGGGSFSKRSEMQHDMWPIFISPNDAGIMYNGGIHVSQSIDGGVSWKQITQWYGGTNYPEIHADVRNVYYSPVDPDVLYFCNDGGVYKHKESTNQWTELTNGLVITQYYRCAVSQSDPNVIIGGSQDNGGSRRKSNGTWKNTNGGDAMEQAIDPTDANIMYTTYVNGQIYRSTDGWQQDTYRDISANIPGGQPPGEWVTPYQLDPNDPSVIVAGYDDVWRSTDRGNTWSKISNSLAGGNIQQLRIAPSNSAVIYCSRGNIVYRTGNSGAQWSSYALPGSETITRIEVDNQDDQRLWVTRGGWKAGQKVYESTDGGQNWSNISGSLPNVPTNCIIYQTGMTEGLYVGNDLGVYYKDNTLTDWVSYSTGLPNTIVNDLEIQFQHKKLRAATWGRGMWEADLYDPGSVVVEDCNGVLGGDAKIDDCGVCAGGDTGIEPNTLCCNPAGSIAVEQWNNIGGNYITSIPLDTDADETYMVSELDQLFDELDNVGKRVQALLCPPYTGSYTFWIASDDNGELWLSTDATRENGVKIAQVSGWTSYRAYDANSEQKSVPVVLEVGQQYYLELLQKEGYGGAHYSVAWQVPGDIRRIISSAFLSQQADCNSEIGGTAAQDDCEVCAGGSTGVVANPDEDQDGVLDCFDLCLGYDDRLDYDGDAIPDSCDVDLDGDGTPNDIDLCPFDSLRVDSGLCGCAVPEDSCTLTQVNSGFGLPTINIYPNPANSFVRVSSSAVMTEVEVLTPLGQVCYREKCTSHTHLLNLEHIPGGAYVLRLNVHGRLLMQKLIKNN